MKGLILGALKQAAAAHGEYETNELNGVYDEQWPEWYAEHMARTFREAGYRIVGPDS
jgi:phosphoserine phosphatase